MDTIPINNFHESRQRVYAAANLRRAKTESAFTLIELLVSIGIIAILISIALPAIGNIRRQAGDVVGLSNLRQTGIVLDTYVTQHSGVLPFAGQGAMYRLTPPGMDGVSVFPGYWDLSLYWSSLFHEVAPWSEWYEVWVFPDPRRPSERMWEIDPFEGSPFSNGVTSLRYSRSLFARPGVWGDGPMLENADRSLRPVRMSEVRYPSAKVSMFDGELCVRMQCESSSNAKRVMLFLDGHTDQLALADAARPVRGRVEGMPDPIPLHDTPGGAYGRDYP